MAILDVLGGKDFQKGMVAGAKPFEDKYKQYAEAFKGLQSQFKNDWDTVKTNIDQIIGAQESADRKRLYDLNTQFDIKALTDHEKGLLVAVLYTLAGDNANENQQSYIRSVQKYLDILNPQTQIDFAGIENIESVASQKAILQACMEFLFLARNNTDFFGEYEESLFSLFNVNEKNRLELWKNVLQICSATGLQGLCEKYGYVPVPDENALPEAAEPVVLEKLEINSIFHIAAGHTHTFTAKEITLNADIHCEGSLVFDRCVITYNGYDLKGQIRMEKDTSVSFARCTIIGKNSQKRTGHQDKYLVQGDYGCKLGIENTIFNDCVFFASDIEVCLNNCKILYSGLPLFREYSKFITADRRSDSSSKMENCLIECNETPDFSQDDYYLSLFDYIRNITNCTFKNIPHDVITDGDTIKNCRFSFCKGIVDNASTITECLFENCTELIGRGGFGPIQSPMMRMTKNCPAHAELADLRGSL